MSDAATLSGRDLILDLASDLFLEKGFSGTSMSAIAKAANMTKASLYYHFSNKEDLFIACVTSGYKPALDRLEAIVADQDTNPEKKFAQAFDTLYEIMIGSRVGRMSPLIAEVSRTFPAVASSFHSDYIAPQQALLMQIIQQGVDSGVFAKTDTHAVSHMVFGPMVTLSLSREMFISLDDLDDHFPVPHLKDRHLEVLLMMLKSNAPQADMGDACTDLP